MYYSLRGTLTASDGRMAVVECGGVGYLCTISLQTHGSLPPLGEQVMLYTYLSVREDAMELYGFATLAEREVLLESIRRAVSAAECLMAQGCQKAMNDFN